MESEVKVGPASPANLSKLGMCAMHKQFVVSLADLRYVRIECPQCKTKVILDMQEKSATAEKNNFFAPKECPGCRNDYDSAIAASVTFVGEETDMPTHP